MKSKYFLAGFLAMLFAGCQTDILEEEPVIPAVTGEEITFGSSLTVTEIDTKTIYADEPTEGGEGKKSYYKVSWEDGDQISIYCPQSSNTQRVLYSVTPQDPELKYEISEGYYVAGDPSKSEAVTKLDQEAPGLQWGSEDEHRFSAFYPADKIISSEQGVITAEIPVEQAPVRWEKTLNGTGTTYTGIANTDYAFMWAYNVHNKSDGGDVALKFRPWVTILDVEINGPEGDREVKMSSVQLRSLSGETLTGRFTVDFKDVEKDPTNTSLYPTYAEVDQGDAVRNQITIQLYDQSLNNGQGDFITLSKGDKIVVRFYLLPKDVNYDTSGEGEGRSDLQIRVAPFNSAVLTRTLNAQGGTQHGGILAHKVNKVILPPVNQAGPNDWMSSLDPNIYVTELSLPGSKMSYQTKANGANVAYQTLTIANQMDNGIRAFQIQTASENTYWSDYYADPEDQHLRACVAGKRTDIPFSDIVKDIAAGLKRAEERGHKNEYAFILLTASISACDDYGGSDILVEHVLGEEAWMEAIKTDLAAMAFDDDTYRLYTEKVTPATTIADVAGHIIIKVNYNNDNMANRLNENDQIPAMFAQWGVCNDITTPFTEINAYAINAMRWGTSSNTNNGGLQWFYHEATYVGYQDGNPGDDGETESQKKNNIEDMWDRSIEYYHNNDNHSMWFLNDLGGSYVSNGYSSGESQDGVDAWTMEVGPYATRLLQSRTEDATLGIVLMNYADPANPYSGNLIQTIINNNFNFQLRTASQSTSSYSIPTRSSSDGWDE